MSDGAKTTSYWEDQAINNHYVSVSVNHIPHHLRPIAAEMAQNGEEPWALTTMTQALMHDVNSRQPTTVHYAAERTAFNSNGSLAFKQF